MKLPAAIFILSLVAPLFAVAQGLGLNDVSILFPLPSTLTAAHLWSAHTVGGVDGGPGVPVTGWSREHGDVRVPHFIGLHALQVLGVIGLLVRRSKGPETARVRVVLAAAASYAVFFALLLWQALRGQSVVAPDAAVLISLTAWAAITAVAVGWIVLASRNALDRRPA